MAQIIQFPKKKADENVVSLETYRQHKTVFEMAEYRRKLLKMQKELQDIKRRLLLRAVEDGDGEG